MSMKTLSSSPKRTDALSGLEQASRQLLSPGGIGRRDIEKTLDQIIVNDIDYADLYFEYSQAESWVLEEGIIREGSHSIDQGVGVRAVSGDKTGFAYSDEIVLPALTDAAHAARAIARSGGAQTLQAWQNRHLAPLYAAENPLDSIPAEQKDCAVATHRYRNPQQGPKGQTGDCRLERSVYRNTGCRQ